MKTRLRKQINAKYIMNQLSSGKTVNIIRGFVYKNGNDREKGQLIVGTSIQNVGLLFNNLVDKRCKFIFGACKVVRSGFGEIRFGQTG